MVKSPYWEHNPGSAEREPKMAVLIPKLTPEQVGAAVVCGVERNKKLIVIPFMRVGVALNRCVTAAPVTV